MYYRHVGVETVLGTEGLATHFTVVAEMSSKVLCFNVFLKIRLLFVRLPACFTYKYSRHRIFLDVFSDQVAIKTWKIRSCDVLVLVYIFQFEMRGSLCNVQIYFAFR